MMHFRSNKIALNKGFTLVEAIIYFSVLLVVASAAVAAFLSYSDILKEIKVRTMLSDTAQTTLERVTREIRNADDVDPFNTILENANGSLALTNIDNPDVLFAINGQNLELTVTGQQSETLTPGNVSVDEFWVYEYNNADTTLVRVELTLTATSSDVSATETFYSGSVLRGSYD